MVEFSFGSVLNRMFSIIGRSFASVGLLIIGIQAIITAIHFAFVRPMLMQTMSGQSSPFAMFSSPAYWLSSLVFLLLFGLLFAGATHGFIAAGEGKPVSLADCIQAGVAKALPVVALTILWLLGVWVGMIFLIVPGIILMIMWSVCIPVLVSGNAGILGSFGKSRALTSGARWKIFALLLLFVVIYYAVYMTLLGSMFAYTGPDAVSAAMTASQTPAMLAGGRIVSTLMMFLLPALLSAIYLEAAHGRLGAHDGVVAEVFS